MQVSPMAIAQKVMMNRKVEEQWYSSVLNTKLRLFSDTQELPKNELNYIFPTPNDKNNFMMLTATGLPTTDSGYVAALELNYRLNVPLFAISFSGIFDVVAVNEHGEMMPSKILYITFETPLKRERQIFNVVTAEDGKQSFELDEFKSHTLQMPPEVNRFNFIIQPSYVILN